MSNIKKAQILRSFPKHCKFCFDNTQEQLLVQDRKTLYLIELKTNLMTELFSAARRDTDTFGFYPDGQHAYACVKRCANSSTVYKIELKTRAICQEIIVPLETCETLCFSEQNLMIMGNRYDTHIESCDGHELIDTYLFSFTLDLASGKHHLEELLDEKAYCALQKSASQPQKFYTLPKTLNIYTYQNTETEFWDDNIYYELHNQTELLQKLKQDEVMHYVGKPEDFAHFAIVCHEDFFLLVGYIC